MRLLSEKKGAGHALIEKATSGDGSILLSGLQALREVALQKAIKYRWDPILGKTHDEYLSILNGILEEISYEY